MRTLTKLTIFFIFLFSVEAEAKLFIPSVDLLKPLKVSITDSIGLDWEGLKLPYLSDKDDESFNAVLELAKVNKGEAFFEAMSLYKRRYPLSVKRFKRLEALSLLIKKEDKNEKLLSLINQFSDTPRASKFNTQLLFGFVMINPKNTSILREKLFRSFSFLTQDQKTDLIIAHSNSLIDKKMYKELGLFLNKTQVRSFSHLYMNYKLFTKFKRGENIEAWLSGWKDYREHLSNENLFNLGIYLLGKNKEEKALAYFDQFLLEAKGKGSRLEARLIRSLIIKRTEQLKELRSLSEKSGYIKERADLYLAALGDSPFPKVKNLDNQIKIMRWAARLFSYERQNDPRKVIEYGKMLPLDKMSLRNQRYFKNLVEGNVGIYFAQLMVKEDFSHIFKLWEKLNDSFEFNREEKIMITLAAFKTNHLEDLKRSTSAEKFNLVGLNLLEAFDQLSKRRSFNLGELILEMGSLSTQLKSFIYSEFLKVAIEENKMIDTKVFELAAIGIKNEKGQRKLFVKALYTLIESENTGPSKMVWACENLLRINPNHLGRDGINLKRAIAESKLLRLRSQEKLVTQVLKN